MFLTKKPATSTMASLPASRSTHSPRKWETLSCNLHNAYSNIDRVQRLRIMKWHFDQQKLVTQDIQYEDFLVDETFGEIAMRAGVDECVILRKELAQTWTRVGPDFKAAWLHHLNHNQREALLIEAFTYAADGPNGEDLRKFLIDFAYNKLAENKGQNLINFVEQTIKQEDTSPCMLPALTGEMQTAFNNWAEEMVPGDDLAINKIPFIHQLKRRCAFSRTLFALRTLDRVFVLFEKYTGPNVLTSLGFDSQINCDGPPTGLRPLMVTTNTEPTDDRESTSKTAAKKVKKTKKSRGKASKAKYTAKKKENRQLRVESLSPGSSPARLFDSEPFTHGSSYHASGDALGEHQIFNMNAAVLETASDLGSAKDIQDDSSFECHQNEFIKSNENVDKTETGVKVEIPMTIKDDFANDPATETEISIVKTSSPSLPNCSQENGILDEGIAVVQEEVKADQPSTETTQPEETPLESIITEDNTNGDMVAAAKIREIEINKTSERETCEREHHEGPAPVKEQESRLQSLDQLSETDSNSKLQNERVDVWRQNIALEACEPLVPPNIVVEDIDDTSIEKAINQSVTLDTDISTIATEDASSVEQHDADTSFVTALTTEMVIENHLSTQVCDNEVENAIKIDDLDARYKDKETTNEPILLELGVLDHPVIAETEIACVTVEEPTVTTQSPIKTAVNFNEEKVKVEHFVLDIHAKEVSSPEKVVRIQFGDVAIVSVDMKQPAGSSRRIGPVLGSDNVVEIKDDKEEILEEEEAVENIYSNLHQVGSSKIVSQVTKSPVKVTQSVVSGQECEKVTPPNSSDGATGVSTSTSVFAGESPFSSPRKPYIAIPSHLFEKKRTSAINVTSVAHKAKDETVHVTSHDALASMHIHDTSVNTQEQESTTPRPKNKPKKKKKFNKKKPRVVESSGDNFTSETLEVIGDSSVATPASKIAHISNGLAILESSITVGAVVNDAAGYSKTNELDEKKASSEEYNRLRDMSYALAELVGVAVGEPYCNNPPTEFQSSTNKPITGDLQVAKDTQVIESASLIGELQVMEDAPVVEKISTANHTLVVDGTPSVDASAVRHASAVDDIQVFEDESVTEDNHIPHQDDMTDTSICISENSSGPRVEGNRFIEDVNAKGVGLDEGPGFANQVATLLRRTDSYGSEKHHDHCSPQDNNSDTYGYYGNENPPEELREVLSTCGKIPWQSSHRPQYPRTLSWMSLHSMRFNCANSDCRRMLPYGFNSRQCAFCGPRSFIRYCGDHCYYSDAMHWKSCQLQGFEETQGLFTEYGPQTFYHGPFMNQTGNFFAPQTWSLATRLWENRHLDYSIIDPPTYCYDAYRVRCDIEFGDALTKDRFQALIRRAFWSRDSVAVCMMSRLIQHRIHELRYPVTSNDIVLQLQNEFGVNCKQAIGRGLPSEHEWRHVEAYMDDLLCMEFSPHFPGMKPPRSVVPKWQDFCTPYEWFNPHLTYQNPQPPPQSQAQYYGYNGRPLQIAYYMNT